MLFNELLRIMKTEEMRSWHLGKSFSKLERCFPLLGFLDQSYSFCYSLDAVAIFKIFSGF